MSKKVFILGIGGSGSRVASLIANKQLNNVDRIISLAIDTDIKELNEIQNISKIQITNMETVSQTVERIGSEKISNWFPIGEEYSTQFLKTIDMHKGSHLWRMQALLALNDYLLNEEKKLELTTIIDEMFKDEDAEFDFYVVTSLCGGTGSGIYLPLSFYIKNYVKEKYKLNIKFNLVLNCPDVYIDSISGDLKTKAYANAYASLQELNNVIEVANGYNQKAMKNYQTIIDFKLYLGDEIIYNSTDSKYYDIKSLPFNQILLFDKIPSIIGVGNHESILSSLISMLITRIKEESTTQNKNMLSSIFMTKITYPYQSNIDYILIKKTYDEISKQWLNFYNYINNQKELRKNDVYEFVPKYNKVNFEADKLLDVLDILEDNENFDEFVLNRVHEKDKNNLVEYYKDNENYVIEEFRKKLLKVLFNKHYNFNSTKFIDRINNEIIEEKLSLFDSQDKKNKKKQVLVDSTQKLNDILNDFYKAILNQFYQNKNDFIKNELLPELNTLLKNNDKDIHPMIAYIRLLRLYKDLSIHLPQYFTISESNLNDDDYKVYIPEQLYYLDEMSKVKHNKYALSGENRFLKVLKGEVQNIKNLCVDFSLIKLDALKVIDNVNKYINYYYVQITCKFLNDLLLNYNLVFKGLKNVLKESQEEISTRKNSGSINNSAYINVGTSVEEKEFLYNEFCKTEDNFKYEDSLAGKLFFDSVVKAVESAECNGIAIAQKIFNAQYEHYKQTLKDNNVIKTIKDMNIVQVLERTNPLINTIDDKNMKNKLRAVNGGVTAPLNIKNVIKNDTDSPIVLEKMIMSKELCDYIYDNKNRYDILSDNYNEVIEQFIYKMGSTKHLLEFNDALTVNELLVTNEITQMPLYWFNKIDELDVDNIYYKHIESIVNNKKINMSELWNPYIYKSKGKQNLLYVNPKMQSLYEEKTIKAFLWMLISNKVFLDYEDKNNKKSKYVYYSLFNGFDKPITINEEVIQEKELDKLFAYINQNIDILNMWSKEFDKYLEKQTKEIKVNNESSKFIDSVEKYILNSSLVQILTTNIYDYIRTVKKVKAKSLIEYLYDSTIEFNNYNSLVIKVIANFIKQQIMKYLEGTEYDYSVVYKNIVKTLIAYLNNFITDIDKLSVMAKWLKKLFG